MTRINWDRKCSKPQSWIYKIDIKFWPPLPPPSPNQGWENARFGFHPWLEGMGVCCSIVFCPRMQVGKRQVTNVMKEIIVDLVKIPRDMINWLSFIYLSYCVSFVITIRLRAVSLFSWSVKQNARDWRRETGRSLAHALPSLNLQKAVHITIFFLV